MRFSQCQIPLRFLPSVALLACLLGPIPVGAQGWFAGGALGRAAQQHYDIGGPVATRDDTDDSYRVFGGYLVSPRQGVVASWIDLGKPSYHGPAFGGFTDSLSAEGIDISWIVGFAPGAQDRVTLFGTVGVFAWDQVVRYTDTSGFVKYEDEGTSFSVGLGTEIRLGKAGASPWGLHLEWQLFKDVGDAGNSGHADDREAVSVGTSYRFGHN